MLRPSRRPLWAGLLAAHMAAAGAAEARGPIPLGASSGCFSRSYDAAHLAAHPRQRVEAIWLGRTAESAADPAGPGIDAVLGFGFRLAGRTYTGLAYCRRDRCAIEGDSGEFVLSRRGADMRLAVGAHLSLEGASDVSPDLARSADDRVFLLHPAPSRACR